MPDLIMLTKAGAALLTSEKTRKTAGWVVAVILSPAIVLVALICCLASGAAQHNAAAADLCFLGGELPADMDPAYAQCIYDMRASLTTFDIVIAQMQEMTVSGSGLNATQIKSAFFSLCFGGDNLPVSEAEARSFVDCFVRHEITMQQELDAEGNVVMVEHTIAVPLSLGMSCQNLQDMGYGVTDDTAETILSAYDRYAYHGGSFSGTIEYGSVGNTTLSISGFSDPSAKNAADLVVYAIHAWESQWGYVWGTFGQVLTESLLQSKIQQYPSGVGDKEEIIRTKWLGRRTADCVGLIKSYGWLDASSMCIRYGSNGMPDIGADAMYYNAQIKGSIDTIPEVPGLAVWHSGHIGIYIGNGEVIEAMGTAYGVVKTKLTERNWTAWLQIPYIAYP